MLLSEFKSKCKLPLVDFFELEISKFIHIPL